MPLCRGAVARAQVVRSPFSGGNRLSLVSRLVDLDGIYAAALVTEIEHPGHRGEDSRPAVLFFEQLWPIINKLDENELVAFAVQGTGSFGRHQILVLFPFRTEIDQIQQIKDQITLFIYDALEPQNVNA